MYISCDVSLLPSSLHKIPNNINTCMYTREKKPCYICRFQYALPFMYETNFLEPLQMDGNNPIFKTIFAYTSKLFFERFKINKDLLFSRF
jgi:hypothetical protein